MIDSATQGGAVPVRETDLLDHWPAMVRVARSVLGPVDGADDCAARALLQVIEQPPGGIENLEAYLVTLAKRRALDVQRSQARARKREVYFAAAQQRSTPDIAEDLASKAEALWLDAAAKRLLTPRTYHLLRLVADGVPVREVAVRLELTPRAVESRLHQARKVLRREFAKSLVLVAAGWAGTRRVLIGSAPPALTAAAATGILLALPHVTAAPPVGTPGVTQPRVATLTPGRSLALVTEKQADPTRDSGMGVQRAARRAQPAAATNGTIARVEGPQRASATVREGDSGTQEEGPAEMVLACVNRVEVTPTHIGC